MPKMKFFRQPAAMMQKKSLSPAEAKRRLKQQDSLKENPCGAKTKKAGSAIVAGTKKLYFSVLALASAPACSVINDKVEKAGWIAVGSIVGIMVAAIGVQAIVEKIISTVKAKKENSKIEKEEPQTNWSVEADP